MYPALCICFHQIHGVRTLELSLIMSSLSLAVTWTHGRLYHNCIHIPSTLNWRWLMIKIWWNFLAFCLDVIVALSCVCRVSFGLTQALACCTSYCTHLGLGGCSLFHLYNVLGNSYGRFLIFKRVIKLAVAGKVTDLIVPSFKRMDAFLLEWNIGESDKRDLFLSATNILKDQKG